MNWKNAALAASALAVVGTAAARATITSAADSAAIGQKAQAYRSAPVVEALSPVFVIAKRPSLTEILDIILHERPTAAELTGRAVAGGDFPPGSEEAHVAGVLRKYTTDRARANTIAASLVKEGRRRKVGSSLLLGVLLTENPWHDPKATSFVGARGLMQVMPFHAGKWGCKSNDLFDIESNICHGVAILADNLGSSRTLPQALLGYNGCVRGTNTPDCWKYPRKVYGYARKGTPDKGAFSAGGRGGR
jgi:soluble lytic murein transglycosylase-like protein